MPIKRAPYLTYTEQVNTVNYSISTGADVLAIIAPTRFAKIKEDGSIKTKEITVNKATGEEITGTAPEGVQTETKTVTDWQTPTIKEDEILIFNRYEVAEQMVESEDVKAMLKDFFLENIYYSSADNLGVNAVMVVPLPVENMTTTNVLDAYKLLRKYKRITAIGCFGIGDFTSLPSICASFKSYLMDDQKEGNLKIMYIQVPERGENETIQAYATEVSDLSESVDSSRIAFVSPDHYGTLLAKICNTRYFIEPGYLPINSVSVGTFETLSSEERDRLCMSGLIFGEDDVLLPTTVPRLCLGVSSSFGRAYNTEGTGYETRIADSLLHARRNVDHHVREVLGILATQLKRNETSVSLRYIQNQVMSYFENELRKGTIQAYSFNVVESSYNPYCLLVDGAIVPVNSTLAVEFNNTIQAPYTIASDYV